MYIYIYTHICICVYIYIYIYIYIPPGLRQADGGRVVVLQAALGVDTYYTNITNTINTYKHTINIY